MASSTYKHLIFDLGGVLLEWDRNSLMTISPAQFLTIMNSTAWHAMDRGKLSVKAACQHFGQMLDMDPSIVEKSLDEAQTSLQVNNELVQTIHDLRAADPSLRFYVLSNISKEHFELVQKLDLPWSIFTRVFASGHEGLRKPDLPIFEHVIREIGAPAREMMLIDDTVENICAAQSLGIDGIWVNDKLSLSGGALRNRLLDPLPRAEAFLRAHAGRHDCVIEGHEDIRLKDNFAQLMIWELTGDKDLVYLRSPSGAVHDPAGQGTVVAEVKGHGPTTTTTTKTNGVVQHVEEVTNGVVRVEAKPNGVVRVDVRANDDDVNDAAPTKLEAGLWNYFYEKPVFTTRSFPADADTTSTAYLSLPAGELPARAVVDKVLDGILANRDEAGITQTYFDAERPRTNPEVCCNIVRFFRRFGRAGEAALAPTRDWVVKCLRTGACRYGNRHYSTPESFLYYAARLYDECAGDAALAGLRDDLAVVRDELRARLGVPVNPLALALRLAACHYAGLDPDLYRRDLAELRALQDADGGWPAGHFCCYGRTGARIGNRGLTTALAIKVLSAE